MKRDKLAIVVDAEAIQNGIMVRGTVGDTRLATCFNDSHEMMRRFSDEMHVFLYNLTSGDPYKIHKLKLNVTMEVDQ